MGFVGGVRRVLHREARRIVERRSYCAMLTLLPALAMLLFGLLFVRPVKDLPVALLDEDMTPLSRRLSTMVDATSGVNLCRMVQSADEGEDLVRRGEVYALMIIPEGFERSLLGGGQARVALYNSGANMTTDGVIERDVQTTIRTLSVGTQLQLFEAQGLSPEQAVAMALPVTFDRHILFNPWLNYAYYLAPSFMAMVLLVFAVLTTIYAIGSEFKESSAHEWLDSAEGSMSAALCGKLLLPTLAMIAWGAVMFFILFVLLGAPMRGSLWVLALATVAFVLSYEAMGVLFVVLFDNMRLALSVGGGYSVLSFSFSGVTFPSMAMYAPIRLAGNLFPLTFYMRAYVDVAVRGIDAGYVLPYVAVMMLFWLLPPMLLPRLRRVCSDEKYWGKS